MRRKGVRIATTAATLALGSAVGWLFHRYHVPLGWILGALITSMAVGLTTGLLVRLDDLRRGGQLFIGASVGLQLTPELLGGVVHWIPLMIAMAFVSMLGTFLLAPIYARMVRTDLTTAYFSLTPGGLSEMAATAAKYGAELQTVAVTQTIRVIMVVMLVPPMFTSLAREVTEPAPHAQQYTLLSLLVLGALTFGLARVMRVIKFGNPYLVGGVFGGAIFTFAGGGIDVPDWLVAAAQVALGYSIGTRFRKEMLHRLPRVFRTAPLFGGAYLGLCLLVALAFSFVTTADLPTSVIVTAPGGLAEMVLLADRLQLNVGLVLGFQVTRSVVVNGLGEHLYRLSFGRKLGGTAAVEKD